VLLSAGGQEETDAPAPDVTRRPGERIASRSPADELYYGFTGYPGSPKGMTVTVDTLWLRRL
jgi:hypothetical protein